MNEKRMKLILDQLGKDAFPDGIEPWAAIQPRLAGQAKPRRPRVLRLAAAVGIAILLLVAVMIALPERQALAEALRHLFQPAAATAIPVPAGQIIEAPTAVPTFAARLVTAPEMEPADPPTPVPTESSSSSPLAACGVRLTSYACKMPQAEKEAGFDAKEFPADPKGLVFQYIPIAEPGLIMVEYVDIGGGGILDLTQGLGNQFPSFSPGVPEDSIEEVQVGSNRGEFVAGDYAAAAGATEYKWIPCCRYRLRWTEGDRWFELQRYGDPGLVKYGDKDILIQLALTLVDSPAPASGPRAEYLTSLAEAAQLAGFEILSPSVLPKGFHFDHASYDQAFSRVKLIYYPDGGPNSGASLEIYETPLDQPYPYDIQGETVEIDGQAGTYSSGSPYDHTLAWQTNKIKITLVLISSETGYGAGFTKEQTLDIAKSMK